jgi:hypothetical protein
VEKLPLFSSELIAQFGLFGSLFVFLLVYILKENSKREERYRSTIKELTEILNNTLTKLTCDVSEIKEQIRKLDRAYKK